MRIVYYRLIYTSMHTYCIYLWSNCRLILLAIIHINTSIEKKKMTIFLKKMYSLISFKLLAFHADISWTEASLTVWFSRFDNNADQALCLDSSYHDLWLVDFPVSLYPSHPHLGKQVPFVLFLFIFFMSKQHSAVKEAFNWKVTWRSSNPTSCSV